MQMTYIYQEIIEYQILTDLFLFSVFLSMESDSETEDVIGAIDPNESDFLSSGDEYLPDKGSSEESEEDMSPPAKRRIVSKASLKKKKKRNIEFSDDSDDDNIPLARLNKELNGDEDIPLSEIRKQLRKKHKKEDANETIHSECGQNWVEIGHLITAEIDKRFKGKLEDVFLLKLFLGTPGT